MITLELSDSQAQALHAFLWTATIDWNAVSPDVSRSRLYKELPPIVNQLETLLSYDTAS